MSRVHRQIFENGIQFECQCCGNCCRARGNYGYVYVTLPERQRLARHLEIPTRQFTNNYCDKTDGFFHLKDTHRDCTFLQGNQCRVYEARPDQCHTWPFWLENMKPRVWRTQVAPCCSGVGQGPLHSSVEIEKRLKDEEKRES